MQHLSCRIRSVTSVSNSSREDGHTTDTGKGQTDIVMAAANGPHLAVLTDMVMAVANEPHLVVRVPGNPWKPCLCTTSFGLESRASQVRATFLPPSYLGREGLIQRSACVVHPFIGRYKSTGLKS